MCRIIVQDIRTCRKLMEVTGRRITYTISIMVCERDEEGHRERMREVTRYFRNAVAVFCEDHLRGDNDT